MLRKLHALIGILLVSAFASWSIAQNSTGIEGGIEGGSGGGGATPAGSNYATQYNDDGDLGGAGPGTSGHVLTSNGSMSPPSYQAPAAPTGAALTRTSDTNVTLTLGGSPSSALLAATSITAGWSGTLAASRGGLGMSTVTDDTIAVANGSGWVSTAVPNCADTGGQHLNYETGSNAFSCGTSGSGGGGPEIYGGIGGNGGTTCPMGWTCTDNLNGTVSVTHNLNKFDTQLAITCATRNLNGVSDPGSCAINTSGSPSAPNGFVMNVYDNAGMADSFRQAWFTVLVTN